MKVLLTDTTETKTSPTPQTPEVGDPLLHQLNLRMAALAAELDHLREAWKARYRHVNGYTEACDGEFC